MSVAVGLGRWTPDPPGENRPTTPRWPRWRLLLDDPAPATVRVVGEVAPSVERWLGAIGAEVRRGTAGPDEGERADLVVVGDDAAPRADLPDALRGLAGSCGPGGAIWLPGDRTERRVRALAAAGFARRCWLPATEHGRRARRPRALGVVASVFGPGERPPRWLVDVTDGVGWDPTGPWTLALPGAYPSQKAVAVVRPARPGGAAAVVKLAQDPRYDGRVANEARALRALADALPAFAARRAPALLAETRVAGTAAVVEEALLGAPFLEASSLRPDCPLAADAAAAVTELAVASRGRTTGAALADALAGLLARYVELQHPPPAVADELARQILVVATRTAVPTVVVHGDLGTWNLLVVDGRVRILDWESAGTGGPPVWDLAHLVRSYAVRAGRARGLPRAQAIGRHLVKGSPLTRTMAGWMRAHRDSLGIDPELGEALFHTCFLHRAVKEASRLGPGQVGHYGPLCALLVTRRRAPGLRQLLGT